MTTSYVLEARQELKRSKQIERAAEILIQEQAVQAKIDEAKTIADWAASKEDRVSGVYKAPVAAEPVEMERARTDAGHFIADDPETPDVNEAYVPKKTAAPKKKAAAKPKAKARSKK